MVAETPLSTVAELVDELKAGDMNDLCDATESAIEAGGGFGWLDPPARGVLETYWKGVLLVPERRLVVARLDGTICGSAQLCRPPRNNEAQAFAAQLQHAFVAPWARGHGLARMLTEKVEEIAREGGFEVLTLDVRESQERAIKIYESMGYIRWGTNPYYAKVGGLMVGGLYYYKLLAAGAFAAKSGSQMADA